MRALGGILLVISLLLPVQQAFGQKPTQGNPAQDQKPADQEPVRVFTEEVRLPVLALDDFGHFDPTLELNDLLILEDGVPQEVRSIRHSPASVLFLLDTGGDGVGLGGASKRTWTTRQTANRVIAGLPQGDSIAVIQFNDTVEMIQSWTDDKQTVTTTLARKLHSGRRVRLAQAFSAAAEALAERPDGSRHVVLITDGVETPDQRLTVAQGVKQLQSSRAAIHIISYTHLVQQKAKKKSAGPVANQRHSAEVMANAGRDPTLPPGVDRGMATTATGGVGIVFDPAMKKKRSAYESDVRKSEVWLKALAADTGGRIFLPAAEDEMIGQGEAVARDIGAEYVVTYRPKRSLADAAPGEYRKVEIAPRRAGLSLMTMRGYTAKPAQ